MNQDEIKDFIDRQSAIAQENSRIRKLVKGYKKSTPKVNPIWDHSHESISYNDLSKEVLSAGLVILSANFSDVWSALHRPEVYEATTLWKSGAQGHNPANIAKVIECWVQEIKLSPIFLCPHENGLALVCDGKHRLTVARYMGAEIISLMVCADNLAWFQKLIPNAHLVLNINGFASTKSVDVNVIKI